jgi:uncharacterized protein YukE
MTDPDVEAMSSLLAAEMEKINTESSEFNAQFKDQQTKIADVYAGLLAKVGQPKQKPLAPEIQEIVNVLQAQPRFIPFIQRTLQQKVAELNAAIDSLLG